MKHSINQANQPPSSCPHQFSCINIRTVCRILYLLLRISQRATMPLMMTVCNKKFHFVSWRQCGGGGGKAPAGCEG